MKNVSSIRGKCTSKVRIREYGGYKVISFGRVKILQLNDENYDVNKIPKHWNSGVSFEKNGVTFTPSFMLRLRRRGLGVLDLKNLIQPEKTKTSCKKELIV